MSFSFRCSLVCMAMDEVLGGVTSEAGETGGANLTTGEQWTGEVTASTEEEEEEVCCSNCASNVG